MTLILPGVEIQVVKEIVAGQLNPSGILGLIGITEENKDGSTKKVARGSSFKEFKGLFGRSADYTVPEAKQAFQNGVSEVVMVPIKSSAMTRASLDLKGGSGDTVFTVACHHRHFYRRCQLAWRGPAGQRRILKNPRTGIHHGRLGNWG